METIKAIFKSSENVKEILVNTSMKNMITPHRLIEALKIVGPVATTFNFTIKEMAEVIGVMANHGVNYMTGAIRLRDTLNSLIGIKITNENIKSLTKFMLDLIKIEDLSAKRQAGVIRMITSPSKLI